MKTIELNTGKSAIVDDSDYKKLSKYKWYEMKRKHTSYVFRVTRKNRKQISILMHREILGILGTKLHVDHIDRNGLNNSKNNLRTCTHKQNQANKPKRKGLTSKYKGVSWKKDRSKWAAQIKIDGKVTPIGRYDIEEEAAEAYNEMANKVFGEFAVLNKIQR